MMKDAALRVSAYGAVAALALWLGVRLAPPILLDDAAISLRYAERLAAGRGFTYNDHERVLGASNPLYVLLLAAPARLGVPVEQGARFYALAFFVAAALLAALLAERLSNPLGAFLAGVLVITDWVYERQALCGMESGLAVVMGLATLAALAFGGETLAGVCLGIALWNKLDAAGLALAVVLAWVLVNRRMPWRVLALAAAIAFPWFAFSTGYFGSPLPHSLLVKLRSAAGFDPLWVWRSEGVGRWALVAVGTIALLATLRREPARLRAAAWGLPAWLFLHGAAISLINMGDRYPWYLTVLLPPAIDPRCRRGRPASCRARTRRGLESRGCRRWRPLPHPFRRARPGGADGRPRPRHRAGRGLRRGSTPGRGVLGRVRGAG